MPKIIKDNLIYVLAFFILGALLFLPPPLNAQDIKTLDNGLRVVIREDHRNPLVVFSAYIDVGSAHEKEYLGSGISHLIEHMLFKGTQKYPPGAIEDILHKYGGNISGWTSYDYTGFSITILKEHSDVALSILKEMLTAPLFNAKELKKEMQVIEREMDLIKDEPGKRLSRLTFSNAYIRHPYRIPIIGYKENFKSLDRRDAVKFFKSNYVPENIVIAAVGDMDKETVFEKIKGLFEGISRGKTSFSVLPREPEQITERYVEEKRDIDGAYLNLAFHSTSLLSSDLYAMDLLACILGQGESSRLNESIRIKKELVLSITAYNYTPKEPGLFVVSSVLKEENVSSAIDEILKEIYEIQDSGINDEELNKAKNNFIADYIRQKETIESQASDLALSTLLTGNPCFFKSYIEEIKSVTKEDVRRAAAEYLKKSGMTVSVISRSGDSLKLLSEPVPETGERGIKKIVLQNGLSVLVCEDHSLPVLSVTLLFKGGVRVENEDNNGISKLTSLMLKDGTSSMSREEIARFYESKGISMDAYSSNNSLGISAVCLKQHTEDTLKLLSDLCLNPAFPEQELKREKNEINSAIDMHDNNVFNHGHRVLKETLFKAHPYRFQSIGTHESIGIIKRQDVLDFHKEVFLTGNMILGISGDCDIQEIETLARKYFAQIPSGRPGFDALTKGLREEPAIEEKRETRVKTDKEQSLVLFGFHGIDIYSKDRYALEVLVDIFSSESGILFKSIREKSGLSYATGGFEVLGLDPGYVAIYTLTSKENIDKVKDIMFKEITSFIKKGVSEPDLAKVKNHLKAMRQIAMQTNSSFIFTASLDELYGLGYDNYKQYDKKISEVTTEDIKRIAEKILTPDKCAVVILEGTE